MPLSLSPDERTCFLEQNLTAVVIRIELGWIAAYEAHMACMGRKPQPAHDNNDDGKQIHLGELLHSPLIDLGVMNVRYTLQFLGWTAKQDANGATKLVPYRARPDDVTIESFAREEPKTSGNFVQCIPVLHADVCKVMGGQLFPDIWMEQALGNAALLANKVVAHGTGLFNEPLVLVPLMVAFRAARELLLAHVFVPIQNRRPVTCKVPAEAYFLFGSDLYFTREK